jgi:beta-phosphoglucomutase
VTVRAVVFDFDGVIANSEPLHFRAYKSVLAAEGVTLHEADYYSRYLGYDDDGAFRAIARDSGIKWSGARIAALIARKAVELEALEQDGSVLFPGAADAIRATAAIMPIAIASGALGMEIRRVLDHEALTRYFTAIVAAEDTPVSKPAPDPYERAVELIGQAHGEMEPHACVAVEDSKWGLESARAAGLRTVGVAQTYPEHELTAADVIISSMSEFDISSLEGRLSQRSGVPSRPRR